MSETGIALESLTLTALRKIAADRWHKGHITNHFCAIQLRKCLTAGKLPDIPPATLKLAPAAKREAIDNIIRKALRVVVPEDKEETTPPEEPVLEVEAVSTPQEAVPEESPAVETASLPEESAPEEPTHSDGLAEVVEIAAALVEAERAVQEAMRARQALFVRLREAVAK